ncbi:MAG: GTPase ObgE [Bdellovibrio sp.]|nr:MAG: GTPase ObgE [Bdellovibrio sp.]
MKFIDEVEIEVASGKGGAGAVSFRREAMVPRGGPDGGDGGRGGDVVLRVSRNLNSLVDFRPRKRYAAEAGHNGEGSLCKGADGKDLVLQVPAGTVVRSAEGHVLADMTESEQFVVARGGRGGKGNAFFKSSVNQAPEHAQPGEPAQEMMLRLELKLIADVGIIGLPNAGKSTLISRISAARPKIADYPFTTLTPNLGVVRAAEFKSFVVADIPGLIKGAHRGVGLGTQFLRHIERTRVFIHLIDASSGQIEEISQNYQDINDELYKYDELNADKEGFFPLSTRPQLVVFSKIDTLTDQQVQDLSREFAGWVSTLAISAVSGKNIDRLIHKVSEFVFGEERGELGR